MATRSVLGGSRIRSVLGGSGIVEGGFERSVSPAMWELQIGDVGGEMGFASVRGGPRTGVCMWGGATSLSSWCVG